MLAERLLLFALVVTFTVAAVFAALLLKNKPALPVELVPVTPAPDVLAPETRVVMFAVAVIAVAVRRFGLPERGKLLNGFFHVI